MCLVAVFCFVENCIEFFELVLLPVDMSTC
jgi:hypothetical protein